MARMMRRSRGVSVFSQSRLFCPTGVVTLDAALLELVTESGMHLASIRFSGLIREEAGQAPQQFEEIWNLQKPASGDAGWMLAGIQQVS